jgi:hypothetical protein
MMVVSVWRKKESGRASGLISAGGARCCLQITNGGFGAKNDVRQAGWNPATSKLLFSLGEEGAQATKRKARALSGRGDVIREGAPGLPAVIWRAARG